MQTGGTDALTINGTQNATFSGSVTVSGGNVNVDGANRKILIGESGLSGGQFGHIGWNDSSDYLFIGHSYNSAFNEDIVIASGGNIGIGVSPTGKLDINISSNARGYFASNIGEVGSGNFTLQVVDSGGSTLKPLGFRADDIRFATGSSERMRLTDTGLGIGTQSPSKKLEVEGSYNIGSNSFIN